MVFGVLTTDNFEQALARAGGEAGEDVEAGRPQSKPGRDPDDTASEHGNIGFDAALVAIEMANLIRALDST